MMIGGIAAGDSSNVLNVSGLTDDAQHVGVQGNGQKWAPVAIT